MPDPGAVSLRAQAGAGHIAPGLGPNLGTLLALHQALLAAGARPCSAAVGLLGTQCPALVAQP